MSFNSAKGVIVDLKHIVIAKMYTIRTIEGAQLNKGIVSNTGKLVGSQANGTKANICIACQVEDRN